METHTEIVKHQKNIFIYTVLVILLGGSIGVARYIEIASTNAMIKNVHSDTGGNQEKMNSTKKKIFINGKVAEINSSLDRQRVNSDSNKQRFMGGFINTDNNSKIDQDYKKRILNYTGPISDNLPELINLANLGDPDAEFRLVDYAVTFCERPLFGTDTACNEGLEDYVVEVSSLYSVMRDLAGKGSVYAMYNLQFFIPSPFKDRKDFRYNTVLRSRHPEIVTDYYQSVRYYLEAAAQKGMPQAMLSMAELYMSGKGVVDPDRDIAAFWMLAWSEKTHTPLYDVFSEFLEPIDFDTLNNIQQRAENFVKQVDKPASF